MTRYVDRSRIERDWMCPRSRYWSTEYGGVGIEPVGSAVELEFGKAVAEALERFRKGEDPYLQLIDDLNSFPTNSSTERQEYFALGEGLVRCYIERVWPRWAKQYKVIGVEVECTVPIPGIDVAIMVRPDAVIEDKETGAVFYLEDKTSSAKAEQFVTHWSSQAQMHLGVRALELKLGRPVQGVIIQGYLKGYSQRGTRYSPFANVYWYPGRAGIGGDDIRFEYTKGFERRGVWNLEGGIERLVQTMPDEVLNKQFPATPPIVVREDIVQSLLEQQQYREAAVDAFHSDERTLDMVFPQHFNKCDDTGWGRECPFKAACFNPSVRRDPVRSGLYRVREPHHEPERKQMIERGLIDG